ncbi:MAG: DNA polymerase III subunit delta [Pseudomonadota bacterium]
MILKGGEATRYFAKPDPSKTGLLISGADPMRVALKRQEVIAALIGPQGEAEMRLSRIPAGDLRKDASLLLDAIKSAGFFPGPRVAFVEDATDALTETIIAALKEWRPGDATIIVTAGDLKPKSTLRSIFEKHPAAFAAHLYDNPPTREEIEDELKKAGLAQIDRAAMADLSALAAALDPGDFRQTLEKIALYKWNDPSPLTPADVAAMAPATIEAEVDDLIHAAADGNTQAIGNLMRRLEGQGTAPVTLCIFALRHFKMLHVASCDPSGGRLFGPRRDQMQRQIANWGRASLETALSLLVETDLTLRSSSRAPGMALMERALIRLAMMKR